MAGLENEAGGVLDGRATGVEQRTVDVDNESALLTQQVEVVVAGQVIDGATVAEVNMLHQPEAGEHVERAVHGRSMHGRMEAGDVFGQVVCGRMVTGRHQGLDHGSPRFGQSAACSSKPALDLLDVLHHMATVHTVGTTGWGFDAVVR